MNAAEKGERYARIFRKAGTFLGKGNIARAVEAFKEGVELARPKGMREWPSDSETKSSARNRASAQREN